ncbi:MAG TPA: hypothetical protein VME41_03430 [Stellaceae bacterium]|nr:hypothetical protein [Stellaceae bacterium]
MRLFPAIAAVLSVACTIPLSAHADGMPPVARLAGHGRHVVHRRIVETRRWVHYRLRRWRRPVPIALAPPVPIYFGWQIPDTLNPGYDRAMVLLYRSPAVSGMYTDDPGFPTTPVVTGAPYQYDVCCAVFQYDGMAGAYVQLSQADAAEATMPPPNGVPIPLPTP